MASILTVNGTTVNRAAARIAINRLVESMDEPNSLEFTEKSVAAGNGTYHQGQSCALTVDGIAVFKGVIVSASPLNIGTGPIDVGYRAFDLSYVASQIPITASDGTGILAYNFPSTDPNHVISQLGKSVGDILQSIFDLHSAALNAIGVTGYTLSELNALTCVPPEPIVISGRLWTQCKILVEQWCNKYAMWIDGAGLIHVANTFTGLSPITLTLDSDPIILDGPSRDHSQSFTKCVARGGAIVEGAFLRLSDASLVKPWTTTQQNNWTVQDFYQPKSMSDKGSVSSMTSTTLTITSSDATKAFAANFWSDRSATVWAINTAASGITFTEQRQVISNTAMTAGGSATLTVDAPFNNSGYTRYEIRGTRTDSASDTGSIASMTSTVLTVASGDATRVWASNFWSGQSAYVLASGPSGTERRAVSANSAMTAGGSGTFTVSPAFSGSGYTRYAIRGTLTDQSMVWRKYLIPNTWIAQHLLPRFNRSMAFNTSSGAAALTWTATAVVCWSQSGSPPYMEFPVTLQVVLFDGVVDGYIVFDQPVVFPFSSKTALESGGASVSAPNDLIVLVPYSRGAMTAQAPASGYEGTAYTVDGVQRTLTVDYPDWLDMRNTTQMTAFAQELLDTVKDTVVEGTVTYLGKLSSALTLGKALNIARAGGTTSWESLAAPVRSVSLEWPQSGANIWVTRLNFSTRRQPFSGSSLYIHPSFGQAGSFGRDDLSITMGPLVESAGVNFGNSVPDSIIRPDIAASMEGVNDASGIEAPDTSGLSQRGVRSGPTADVRSRDAKAERKAKRQETAERRADKATERDWNSMGPSKADQEKERKSIAADQAENARRSGGPSRQISKNTELPSDVFAGSADDTRKARDQATEAKRNPSRVTGEDKKLDDMLGNYD